jgi:uncharacterized protein YndB with AHSA1/START domain
MIDPAGRVVHEIEVRLPRNEVFAFFTDAERLVRWLGLSAALSPLPGGRFRFEVQPGHYCEGSYQEVDPPAFVSFTWGWTDPAWHLPPGSSLVSVRLTPTEAGTRVQLTHDRLPGDLRAIHDEGWTTFLTRLSAAAAGTDMPAYPPEGHP